MINQDKPRISKELMSALFDYIMDNVPVLLDAEGPLEIFFGEMFTLIDEEIERAILEDREARFRESDN
jgi:hypothetical protein